MALINKDYVSVRVKESDLIALTETKTKPDEVNEDMINALIVDAEAIILNAIRGRYAIPPSGTAEAIAYLQRIEFDLFLYFLYSKSNDDTEMKDVFARYTQAYKEANAIQNGKDIKGLKVETNITVMTQIVLGDEKHRNYSERTFEENLMLFPAAWDDVNDVISTMEDDIVEILTDNYPKPIPNILTDVFPSNQAEEDELSNKAKKYANEAHSEFTVVVAYTGSKFGQPSGRVYFPFYSFGILLFSTSKRGHKGIYQLIRATLNIAYKLKWDIYGDTVKPVKNLTSGYFMAIVNIGKKTAYPEITPEIIPDSDPPD